MPLQKIIGIHSSRETLTVRPARDLKKLYLCPGWHKSPVLAELAQLAKQKQLQPETRALKKLNRLGPAHQGVCVEADYGLKFDISSVGPQSVVLILDRVQDPRNFGAIIRTAWLMGVDCVFSSSRNSAVLSPFVIKTASGGVEHVPVEIRDKLRPCMEELKKNQFWIYALDLQSKKSIWNVNFEGRRAFVLGGEASGLRPGLKKICDEILSIPQKHKSGSYNVSVATALVLGESRRRGLQGAEV